MSTVRVRGLRELSRDLKAAEGDLDGMLRGELRDAAGIVAEEARERFAGISARSARGFTPRVRTGGRAFVEQRLRRKTGKRPDFGSLQMGRALLPALEAKEAEVVDRVDRALDRLARRRGF